MQKIKAMGYAVKLDTNGYLPDKLEEAIQSGAVDYVAMDVKNAKSAYAKTVGLPNLDIQRSEKSVDILLRGTVDYEFRTTVVKEFHEEQQMREIAEWLQGAKRYFLQCFSDAGDILKPGLSAHSKETLEAFRQILLPAIPNTQLRGME